MTNPISVKFDENKLVDALMLLAEIHVHKENLCTLSRDELNKVTTKIISQILKSFVEVLQDEEKGPHVVAELISRSNLKYLSRALQ